MKWTATDGTSLDSVDSVNCRVRVIFRTCVHECDFSRYETILKPRKSSFQTRLIRDHYVISHTFLYKENICYGLFLANNITTTFVEHN